MWEFLGQGTCKYLSGEQFDYLYKLLGVGEGGGGGNNRVRLQILLCILFITLLMIYICRVDHIGSCSGNLQCIVQRQ